MAVSKKTKRATLGSPKVKDSKNNEVKHYIDTCLTLFNLILTGNPRHGLPLGRVSNFWGDKSTSKTAIASYVASSFLSRPPEGITPYVLYIDTESAFDRSYAATNLGLDVNHKNFNVAREVIDDVYRDKPKPLLSVFLEDIYYFLVGGHQTKRTGFFESKLPRGSLNGVNPDGTRNGFLVVLDSVDAVRVKVDEKKGFAEQDYPRKSKAFKEFLTKLSDVLANYNAHLMLISQGVVNLDGFGAALKKTGGKGIDYFTSHIIKLKPFEKLYGGSVDNRLQIGNVIQAEVTKNKVSFPNRNCYLFYNFKGGFSELDSLVDYLTRVGSNCDAITTDRKTKSGAVTEYRMKKIDKTIGVFSRKELLDYITEHKQVYYASLFKKVYQEWVRVEKQAANDIPSSLSLADLR